MFSIRKDHVKLSEGHPFGPEGFGFFEAHICLCDPALLNFFFNERCHLLRVILCGFPVACAKV